MTINEAMKKYRLAQNEQDITKWTNIAAGVYGTFGDALPIEGMS